MAYLSQSALAKMGFKSLGRNVSVSDRAAIYNPELIEIGDNSRIDDFCLISGRVMLERNVHIAAYSNLLGGDLGISIGSFGGTSFGCHVFAKSDDYSGASLMGPTVGSRYKKVIEKAIRFERFCIVGANSLIFPGVTLGEGTAIGALSMVTKSTDPWSVYFGRPAKRLKSRSRGILQKYEEYLADEATELAAQPSRVAIG